MNVRFVMTAAAVLGAAATLIAGCNSSEASILTTCAQCGVIRSIDPRMGWGEPPPERAIAGAIIERALTPPGAFRRGETHTFYTVRIRMDRGGARDLMLGSPGQLHVGQRVEIRDGRVVEL